MGGLILVNGEPYGGGASPNLQNWLAKKYDENTRYSVGDYIINPDGVFQKCTSSTSGTYDGTCWSDSYLIDMMTKSTPAQGSFYGFCKVKSINSPSVRIMYEGDCINFTPAHMDYSTGTFNYGDWENAFFMPKPVLISQDCTDIIYLNPDDYTLDVDGNNVASYLSGTSGNYNAMMQWPKIYVSRTTDDYFEHTRISPTKIDETYFCYSNYDSKGNEIDHFYTPIYNGSNVSNVLRSLSGKTPINSQSGTTEISYAQANNQASKQEWYIEQWCDRALINDLLVLMAKSTDTQTAYGNGHYTGGSSASDLLVTGTMNSKGLFWGTNSTGSGVKVFGMENYWGNQWRRTAGLMTDGTALYAKMTWDTTDGTGVDGYQTTAITGMMSLGKSLGGTSGGYISNTYNSNYGCIPVTASGSQSTYECDGLWFNSNVVGYARVGGGCDGGFLCGAFCLVLYNAVSASYWGAGASLSCKPVAA